MGLLALVKPWLLNAWLADQVHAVLRVLFVALLLSVCWSGL
jgi:hypothetical protein